MILTAGIDKAVDICLSNAPRKKQAITSGGKVQTTVELLQTNYY